MTFPLHAKDYKECVMQRRYDMSSHTIELIQTIINGYSMFAINLIWLSLKKAVIPLLSHLHQIKIIFFHK